MQTFSMQAADWLPPRGRRPNRKVFLAAVAGAILLFLASGAFLVFKAVSIDSSIPQRVTSLFFAAAVLFLPFRIMYVAIRRKIMTGQWGITPEEQAKLKARAADQATRPNRIQYWFPAFTPCIAIFLMTRGSVGRHTDFIDITLGVVWIFIAGSSLWTAYKDWKKFRPVV